MKAKFFKPYFHILFWLVVVLILTLVFGRSWGSGLQAFYFICLLLPVIMATSYFFNYFLVPRYLFTKKYVWFALYFFYLLVISLYLQMLVVIFSYMYLANFNFGEMGPNSTDDVILLAFVMYLVVFAGSFFLAVQQLSERQKQIEEFMNEKEKNENAFLELTSNRKLVRIAFGDILYIESLSDYIQVHSVQHGKIVSKEKISALAEILPERFLRIHRSFIVNTDKVTRVTAGEVLINDIHLNIGRTYKKDVAQRLKTI